jgi:hypothetical protein
MKYLIRISVLLLIIALFTVPVLAQGQSPPVDPDPAPNDIVAWVIWATALVFGLAALLIIYRMGTRLADSIPPGLADAMRDMYDMGIKHAEQTKTPYDDIALDSAGPIIKLILARLEDLEKKVDPEKPDPPAAQEVPPPIQGVYPRKAIKE